MDRTKQKQAIPKKQIAIVAVLLVGTFLAVLNQTLATSALPVIMLDVGIDAATAQWLTSGYTLVYAIVIPVSAYLMSRFPTRRLFFVAYGFLVAGSILATIAPSFPLLLIGRLMQAVCVGVLAPLLMTVIMLVFPLERRGIAMGIANLVIGIAPAFGPLFAGVVTDVLGWRAMFAIMATASGAVLLASVFLLGNFSAVRKGSFDKPSVILSSVGLVSLLYGLSTFSNMTNLALSCVLVLVGIGALALFARRQLTIEEPLLRIDVLKVREFRVATLVVMGMQALFMAASLLVPILIQTGMGYTATLSGLVVLPGALVGSFISLASGGLFDRFGVRIPAIAGGVLMAAGFIGLLFFHGLGLAAIGLAMALVTCGCMLSFTPLSTWGINSIGDDRIAHGNSISNTARQASSAFGTALFVSLMSLAASNSVFQDEATSTVAGLEVAFGAAFVLSIIVLGAAIWGTRPRKDEETAPAKQLAPEQDLEGSALVEGI